MRLFQIKIDPVDTMDWIINNEKYEAEYGKRREEALVEQAAQDDKLLKFGITLTKNAPTVISEKQLTDLTVAQVKFELIREISAGDEQDPTDLTGVMRKFNRMAAKLLLAPALQAERYGHNHTAWNERVDVHMPGQALSTYNEIQLLENTCSDELQTTLDKGWRIIAACPQPDARRPDYILGRYNPKRDIVPYQFADRGES